MYEKSKEINDNIVKVIDNDKLIVGFTTRKNGFSLPPYNSFNLGFNTDDPLVKKNFNLLAKSFPNFKINYLKQIHSNIIHYVDEDFSSFVEGDGLYTDKKNMMLMVTTADCGNLVFYDKLNFSLAGIVHAGWRGLKSGIIEKIIDIFLSYNIKKSNIGVFIGPMINGKNYEVSEEFLDFFPSKYFKKNYRNKYNFYIQLFVLDLLKDLGIQEIHNYSFDTYEHKELFYSYRREKETGRIGTFVCLK